MTNPLPKVALRDVANIVTVAVAVAGSYFGLSSKIEVQTSETTALRSEVLEVKRHVERLDDRLWNSREVRPAIVPAFLSEPEPCPADASFVAFR